MKIRLTFLLLLLTVFGYAQKGKISGTVTDKDFNNESLPFANIVIKGTSISTSANEKGEYSIAVDPGTHTLQFSFVGYGNIEKPVTVRPGETVTANASLGAGSLTLNDVVVQSQVNRERESALLVEQKNAVEIKQSIGAQEMSRKGVTTVEGGVTKISGVSKVADRGIFVRGLDDRYNYLQINGLNFIPSDPNLKTIPLSFIPTDVVRNVDVFKTFNTSLYQDFAGATINIITKDISSKPFTKISISAGMNTNTALRDFKTSDEGGGDFFGYTLNNRNLPGQFGPGRASGYQATPTESKEMFGASWTPDQTKAPLNTGVSITNSDVFTIGEDRKAGYIVNFNFGNNFLSQTGQRRNLNSAGTAVKDFERDIFQYQTQKSALASLNYRKIDRYNFLLNFIYIQNSENTVDEMRGENTDFITIDRPFFLRDMKYIENTSAGVQHIGTIYFNEKRHVLDYGVAATIGKNDMPDRKVLITEGEGADADYVTFNGADPFRFFSELKNLNVNGKVEYEIRTGGEIDGRPRNVFRFGYNGDLAKFDFFNRTIRVNGGVNLTDTEINTNDPQAFFDSNFNAGNLYYVSAADPTYKVRINQMINAGFVNYTRNWNKLTLDLGVRAEYLFRQTKYRPETVQISQPYSVKEYTPFDINPVLNLKYLMSENANIRFTASKTSTKPRVREILPFRYQDGDGNFTVGNPEIKNTQNYNVDLKYEVFPAPSAMFGATLFGKIIKNPIPRLILGTSTGFLTYYDNFDQATLFGIELEANFGLDLLFDDSGLARRTSFGLNAILMKSSEEADAEKFPRLTSTSRSLQGASDFILNTDISYELIKTENAQSKVSFIFNTFSDRIYAVGGDGASDIIQKPIHQLDFTWRNTISKNYQLNLSVKNILDSEFLATQDPTQAVAFPDWFSNVNARLSQGVNIGLEFSYTF